MRLLLSPLIGPSVLAQLLIGWIRASYIRCNCHFVAFQTESGGREVSSCRLPGFLTPYKPRGLTDFFWRKYSSLCFLLSLSVEGFQKAYLIFPYSDEGLRPPSLKKSVSDFPVAILSRLFLCFGWMPTKSDREYFKKDDIILDQYLDLSVHIHLDRDVQYNYVILKLLNQILKPLHYRTKRQQISYKLSWRHTNNCEITHFAAIIRPIMKYYLIGMMRTFLGAVIFVFFIDFCSAWCNDALRNTPSSHVYRRHINTSKRMHWLKHV